jgi:hypothetical protein
MNPSISCDELRDYLNEQMETLKAENRDPDTMLERISDRHRSGKPLFSYKEINGKQVTEALY